MNSSQNWEINDFTINREFNNYLVIINYELSHSFVVWI